MHAVIAVNTDVLRVIYGEPYDTVNLTSTIQRMEIRGIQNPRFRGFYDGSGFDTDNSIFTAAYLGGPSIAPAAAIDVKVVNADFALNLSDHIEALIENNIVNHAFYGIENWFNRTTALGNEFLDTVIPVFLMLCLR